MLELHCVSRNAFLKTTGPKILGVISSKHMWPVLARTNVLL